MGGNMADSTSKGLWIWPENSTFCNLGDLSAIRVMSSSRRDETIGACSSISETFRKEKSDYKKIKEKYETSHRRKLQVEQTKREGKEEKFVCR